MPAAKWLRHDPLKKAVYEILSPSYNLETTVLFNFKQIKKILDDHISGRRYALNAIWSLVNFQVWYRQFKK